MATQIRGNVLLARRGFVQEHFGADAWQQVLAALSAEDRALFSGFRLLPVGWYPSALGDRIDQSIVDVLGKGDPKVFEEIGAGSARANLGGPHRYFLTPGRPMGFMHKVPSIYGLYYDTGRREWKETGPTSGVMTTYDAEVFSHPDCLTVIGWYREALQMCGARNVRITETACRARNGPHCSYEVSWEP